MLKLDGFDSCIIGTCCRCGQGDIILYSTEMIIKVLIDREGMSWSDAEQFYCLNIVGAWMGEGTPAFMDAYIDEIDDVHSGDVVEEAEHNRRVGD